MQQKGQVQMGFRMVSAKTILLAFFAFSASASLLSYADENVGQGDQLRDFEGIDVWLNSPPLSKTSLKNKVVIIDFYTSRCSNCLAAVPHVVSLYNKYHGKGLEVIGVHTPELESERQIEVVKATAKRLGINYPIAVDNAARTWSAYNNHYWPNLLIFDKAGKLVYQHAGEGAYEEIDLKISSLL